MEILWNTYPSHSEFSLSLYTNTHAAWLDSAQKRAEARTRRRTSRADEHKPPQQYYYALIHVHFEILKVSSYLLVPIGTRGREKETGMLGYCLEAEGQGSTPFLTHIINTLYLHTYTDKRETPAYSMVMSVTQAESIPKNIPASRLLLNRT